MSDELERIDQEIRVNELREAAQEAAGGEMTTWENPETPPEVAEQFWANVLEYEQAEPTCHFLQLEEMGIELPPAGELDDEQVTAKLWEVIHALVRRDTFIGQTDHLSDRELYENLWNDTLREFTPDLPPGSGWTNHIDLCSSGSDEDNYLHLKYYAEDEERERWRQDFPGDEIPPRAARPHDRDSKLPKEPAE